MEIKDKKIRALCFEEKSLGLWSAQCLDHDIAVQAKTFNDLLYELERVMVGHVVVSEELGLEPFEHLQAAPPKFWQLYHQSKVHIEQEDRYPFDLQTIKDFFSLKDVRIAQLQCA